MFNYKFVDFLWVTLNVIYYEARSHLTCGYTQGKKGLHYYLVICQISTTFAPALEEEDI